MQALRYSVCCLWLLFVTTAAIGQQDPPKKVDKETLKKLMDWVSIFTMYSDVDLSDKVDLKEYAEAADLAANFITNPELSVKIDEFKSITFLDVYPKGLVNNEEWIYSKLNQITEAQYSVMNIPFVELNVVFTRTAQGEYLVLPLFKGNDKLEAAWITEANATMSALIYQQKFTSPRQAKEKVNACIFAGLDKLSALVGNTFVPNMAVRYNDDIYLNNQTIEVWRSDNTVALQAVNGKLEPLTGTLTWTGAQKQDDQTAQFTATTIGDVPVSVQQGAEKITVKMRVKEFSLRWQDILKTVLREVIEQLMVEGEAAITESIEKRKQSQQQALKEYTTLKVLIEEQSRRLSQFEVTETTSPVTSSAGKMLVTSVPDDDRYTKAISAYLNFRKLFVEEQFKEVRKIMLASLLVQGNFNKLGSVLERDLTQVATQLIILLARGEGRDELKLFAQQYINQKLDEVISQELNKEMGELYKLINSGASKEVIREWLSAKASEKIVASLN
jgi:hypothetical protein